jgi:hypothetical protein
LITQKKASVEQRFQLPLETLSHFPGNSYELPGKWANCEKFTHKAVSYKKAWNRVCLLVKGVAQAMTTNEGSHGGWNLFARALQDILADHRFGLGHLDDHAHIHPEKVRRLQRSLKVPKSFPMLNVDEMEQVITVFQLNRQDNLSDELPSRANS